MLKTGGLYNWTFVCFLLLSHMFADLRWKTNKYPNWGWFSVQRTLPLHLNCWEQTKEEQRQQFRWCWKVRQCTRYSLCSRSCWSCTRKSALQRGHNHILNSYPISVLLRNLSCILGSGHMMKSLWKLFQEFFLYALTRKWLFLSTFSIKERSIP